MNKYLEKIAKAEPIKKPKKPTLQIQSLNSLENALESTTRMKSLREIGSEKARKSYKSSSRDGAGDAAADAVKAMQRAAQTPKSPSNYTKQKLR